MNWQTRTTPLSPLGVAARGDAARALAERVLLRDNEQISKLSGVAGDALLVILGAAELLPWADGAIYLGRDPLAPALLLPTTHQPEAPLDLFARALRKKFADHSSLAVLFDPDQVIPLDAARTIARESLLKWLKEQS